MKKVLLISMMLIMIVSTAAFAGEKMVTLESNYSFSMSNALYSYIPLDIEFSGAISDSSAYAVRLIFVPSSYFSAYGAGASYRGYFNPTALNGPYWGIGVDLVNISISMFGFKSSVFVVTPKAEIGYDYIMNGGFAIGIKGYAGYAIASGLNQFDGGLGFRIGYSW